MSHIYKITNIINKKIYVGKSLHPSESYFGSGLQITAAIEKYGKENFSKEIIEECSEEILDQQEVYWIEKLDARNPLIGYNISIGGTGGNHYWKSLDEESKIGLKKKISVAKTGATINYTDEQRKNVRAGLKNWWDKHRDDKQFLKERATPKKYILSNKIEFIRIENLKDYCKENKFGQSQLCSISTGNSYLSHNGWYCFHDNNISYGEVLRKIELLEDKQKQVKEGFLEKVRNRKRYTCAYCGKSVTKGNLTRWHNSKCKENGNM